MLRPRAGAVGQLLRPLSLAPGFNRVETSGALFKPFQRFVSGLDPLESEHSRGSAGSVLYYLCPNPVLRLN